MPAALNHGDGRVVLDAVIQVFRRELKALERVDRGCNGCLHSEHRGDGTCRHWKQTVPAEHRAAGCDNWVWDEIPF